MLQKLKVGDEVAILPEKNSPATDACEIWKVGFVGIGYIQLEDGRMYSSTDGHCLSNAHAGHAVIAQDEPRAAVNRRRSKA